VLSSIIQLLRERGSLSVQDICLYLGIESSALHPMLDLLERKGKVEKIELPCKDLLERKGKVEKIELPCKKQCAGGCTQSDAMTFYKIAS